MRALAFVALLHTASLAAPDEGRWHLGVEALTDFPIQVGGQIWAELPYRLRLSTSFGYMPEAYLDVVNAAAVSAGAYGETTADLLAASLDRAFTWRLHVGWYPFRNRGGYFEAGYGLMSMGAGFTVVDVLERATGLTAPDEASIGLGYRLTTLVHTIGVEVGWMWLPWRGLTIRVALGFAATVAAQATIRPNFAARRQEIFTTLAARYLEDLLEKYLFIPSVGLALGWRAF